MGLLFADGGDWAADNTSAKVRWLSASNDITVSASGSKYGTQNYILPGTASTHTVGLSTTAWTGVANILFQGWIKINLNATFTAGSTVSLINLLNGGTFASKIQYDPFTNGLSITGASNAQVGTTDTGSSLNDGGWHFIEWKILLATTATGSSEFRVDGVARSNLTVTSTAFNAAIATTAQIGCNHRTATEYTNTHFDDIIVWNWSSGQVTDFTGKRRIVTLRPNSDSSVAWTPDTGVTNYTQVNKSQYDLTHYVTTSVAPTQDLYGHQLFADIGFTPSVIHAVQASCIGIRPSGTQASVQSALKSNLTTSTNTTVGFIGTPTLTSLLLETDPDTSAAWTSIAVNATTFGPKASTVSGSGVAQVGIAFLEVIGSETNVSVHTTDTITSASFVLTRESIVSGFNSLVSTASFAVSSSAVRQALDEPVTKKSFSIVVETVGEGWRDHISPDYIVRWDSTKAVTTSTSDVTKTDQLLSPQLRHGQPTYVLTFKPFLERNTVANRVASGSPNARWWKKLLNN